MSNDPQSTPPLPPASSPLQASGEPPARSSGVVRLLAAVVLALVMLAVGVGLSDLIKGAFRTSPGSPAAQGDQAQRTWYTCGMHPWVILPRPGLCPVCHMDLVPLDTSKLIAGEVAIDPIITQSFGVRIVPVITGPVTRVIRTVGTVDYDEARVRDVNIKIGGWIEKLYVNKTGQPVKAGEPLFEIYSPDLYNAQTDYLIALREQAAGAYGSQTRQDLLAAVRKRLELFDISDEQIEALAKSGKPSKTLTIRSPFTGLVVLKSAMEGMRAEAGTQLYRIADLSTVWVMATLYESQLPLVDVGQQAVMSLPYIPGQTFKGKVTYIYPYLNSELRQAKVRLEFTNPGLLLKPGMYANVELHSTLAQDRLLVPREVIIDTGQRQLAFVSLGQGRFAPREVQMGVEAQDGMVVVERGLKKDDKVVESGQFLLDSEGRLREDLAKMVKGELAGEQPTTTAPAALPPGGTLSSLPAPAAKALVDALNAYLQIGEALVVNNDQDIPESAKRLVSAVDALVQVRIPQDEHFWHRQDEVGVLRAKAKDLLGRPTRMQIREIFGDMGVALSSLLKATGVPPSFGQDVVELRCPMFRDKQGGSYWLQRAGEVRNPFFGKNDPTYRDGMLRCYDTERGMPRLPVTGARSAQSRPPKGP